MGFHPETPADPQDQEFLCDPTDAPVTHGELEYSMMLIQKFSQLYEASDRFEDFKMNEGIYSLKDELDEID